MRWPGCDVSESMATEPLKNEKRGLGAGFRMGVLSETTLISVGIGSRRARGVRVSVGPDVGRVLGSEAVQLPALAVDEQGVLAGRVSKVAELQTMLGVARL